MGKARPVYQPEWSWVGSLPAGKSVNDMQVASEVSVFCNYKIVAPFSIIMDFDRPILGGGLRDDLSGTHMGGGVTVDPPLKNTQFGATQQFPSIPAYSVFFVMAETKGYVRPLRMKIVKP
jgi:hypothetical protein